MLDAGCNVLVYINFCFLLFAGSSVTWRGPGGRLAGLLLHLFHLLLLFFGGFILLYLFNDGLIATIFSLLRVTD